MRVTAHGMADVGGLVDWEDRRLGKFPPWVIVYRSHMAIRNARSVLTEKQTTVDVIIPAPDSSRVAELNLAQTLGLLYRERFGVVKNRYVGRNLYRLNNK